MTYSKDVTDEIWTLLGIHAAVEKKIWGLGAQIDAYCEARMKQLLDEK